MQTSILIVEDEVLIAKTLARKLKRLNYHVQGIVSSCQAALKALEVEQPHLILMDIAIKGDKDGIETAMLLQEKYRIPVVYLTAYADDETIERASQTLCFGYLLKPFKEQELNATLKMAMSQCRRQTPQVASDEFSQDEKAAYTDELTGLPNQLVLRDRFQQLIQKRAQHATADSSAIAVIYLNLDRFKRINLSVGEEVGDRLLKEVANRLTTTVVAENLTIVRMNNKDEFVFLLPCQNNLDIISNIADQILQDIHHPFHVGEHEVILTASIGISVYPNHGDTIETLINGAKEAVNSAKALGKNRRVLYTPIIKSQPPAQLSLETDLYHALDRNELQLYYQPQVCLTTGTILGAEALLRWIHPERNFVSPGLFIPIAEETGLIEPIGDWIIDQACQFLQELSQMEIQVPRIAVNLSGQQFRQPQLLDTIQQCIAHWQILPHLLELEMTEQILVDNVGETQAKLNAFREMGVKIAIDDFGTGYSSLGYLHQFPFDILKIDRCFIQDINAVPKNKAIVQAIIEMAHHLKLKVIAEGVETDLELEVLKNLNCEMMQGYLFCKPLPKQDFVEFLKQRSQLAATLA